MALQTTTRSIAWILMGGLRLSSLLEAFQLERLKRRQRRLGFPRLPASLRLHVVTLQCG
jgi:hypothetical protein